MATVERQHKCVHTIWCNQQLTTLTVAVATWNGSHAPDADTTLTSHVPDAGAMPRTDTVVEGALPVFLEKDMVLAHLQQQQWG